jgi:hypothetical protein
MCPQQEQEDNNKAKLRPALYVRTNAGKNLKKIGTYWAPVKSWTNLATLDKMTKKMVLFRTQMTSQMSLLNKSIGSQFRKCLPKYDFYKNKIK